MQQFEKNELGGLLKEENNLLTTPGLGFISNRKLP